MRVLGSLLLAACATGAACSAPAKHAARPPGGGAPAASLPGTRGAKLVVLLVLDQWPEWAFEAKRPALTAGGFSRLLGEGEWHVGRHPSVATLTAAGHALLGSGEPPARSGILANEWWHRDLGRVLKAVEGEDGSVTAKWLRVAGLGDAVAAAHAGGRAVGIALKDRAAVLPLGHAGLPIWYDAKATQFRSLAPRPWLDAYNAAHPVAAHLHDVWTPLDPARLAQLSGTTDDRPGEVGEQGFGPTFPHALADTKSPSDAVLATPLGNELVFDTASAALAGEQLGHHAAPDLLVLSLSAHDYVGHGWGQESWEMWDLTLRLDARLAQFLDELDRTVGAGQWAMVVTSDHGACPLPESVGGGRFTHKQVANAANAAAAATLGPGTWIDYAHYPHVYFSKAMLAQPASELASATKRVIYALRSFPQIERVGKVADVAGHCETRTGEDRALCLALDPERSGDVFFLPATGYINETEDERLATAHGSAHDYDRLVPVLLLPFGRAAHAPATAPAPGELAMTDIAPLVARWLGAPSPTTLPPPAPPAPPAPAPMAPTAPRP